MVIIAPYYLSFRQSDIIEHYRQVIEVSSVPVIVYNIPSTTHNPIALDTVLELARDPKVAGTKDSSGDFIPFSRGVIAHSDSNFSWIQGEDYLHGPSLMVGARFCSIPISRRGWYYDSLSYVVKGQLLPGSCPKTALQLCS